MQIFNIVGPECNISPVVLSIPHCGFEFPEDLIADYKKEMLPPDDTDWLINQLYSFASEMGITTISAKLSRWVIDLNRNPDGLPLYNDGRVITALCPSTDFSGKPIYKDERQRVTTEETERRKTLYFEPYHKKLQELLDSAKMQFGKVLLWDCHSIRRLVTTISREPFPDLVLGSADGESAHTDIISKAHECLSSDTFFVSQNFPFKGGYITRNYGRPERNQHALQLEMAKDLYMDNSEVNYSTLRAAKMQRILKNTLSAMTALLLND